MITVSMNGSTISSDIHFVSMTPWTPTVKYKLHEIDGADFDILHLTGKNSATTTLTGVCVRSAANIAILNGMRGSTLTVTHSQEGTRSGVCVTLSPAESAGGTYITFSMFLINQ